MHFAISMHEIEPKAFINNLFIPMKITESVRADVRRIWLLPHVNQGITLTYHGA